MLLPGSVYISDGSFDTTAGFVLLGRVDGFVASKFSVGGQVLLAFPSLGPGGDASVTNVGATAKAHFGSETFRVSPV